ncbi:SusC/RagA family TonB-linked outer membrane protein [Labilibaculum euxinus]|uniref:SusC/RagA family TonB-linked outer membrane protein n=1 Tax=Labilibaculum euxinus TaxID=2686357 RepID=A0A7M4D6B5_9BACT|nr:SusC/RagA family TonB-linked outer membrane protein [Labilibaculum euxinus]MUP38194.1 SusC/RagA family TonB-linked outer membrane protein [Labilibaculum euxinus]MVB07399.1 SusC/RagA family TonB-linked outer membrane protein [Labilibaculum euxinus]
MKRLLSLLLILLPAFGWAQEMKQIKGTVLSESDGDVLIGASVYIDKSTIGAETNIKGIIENITLGTITDFDGNFTLEVPKELNTIACSFLGFETQIVDIAGKSFITIKLSDLTSELGEVVVTGYQKIEKRKLTSAVVKVNANKILQAGVVSVDQMLSGQLAGITAVSQTGAPGAPTKIRIRGTASLSGTQDPLWVLDGIPLEGNEVPDYNDKDNIDQLYNSSIAGLNPQDIADITILKDAAATAIYGARAANGVIVITSKNGRAGKMKVQFTSNTSFISKPDFDRLNLMNATEKVDAELAIAARTDLAFDTHRGGVAEILNANNDWFNYQSGGIEGISPESAAAINALRTIDPNLKDELYQNAVNQDQSVNFSGGNDLATYYFSLGSHTEKGTTIGTSLNRYNVTLKTNFKLSENLTLGVSMFANQRKNKNFLTEGSMLTNPSQYIRTSNPYLRLKDENGNFIHNNEEQGSWNIVRLDYNILEEREGTSHILKGQSLNSIFDLNWKLHPDITFRSQFGYSVDKANTTKEAVEDSFYVRRTRNKSGYDGITDYKYNKYFLPEGGMLKNWDSDNTYYNLKNIVEYSKLFNDLHEVDVMIGNEVRETKYTQVFSAAYGWNGRNNTSKPVVYRDENDAKSFSLFTKTFVKNRYASFFATASYTFNRKYTFFGSVRFDGSDLFGVDSKYRYLPLYALSGSWNANEESFLKNIDWLSSLKFRSSYGLQGNIDKKSSPYIVGTPIVVSNLPGKSEDGITVEGLPNEKLRWEKTSTYNVGFDLAVLRHAVRMSFDYYTRKGTDLIGIQSVPTESGFNSMPVNWASMTNKGWEFSISTRNIQTENFEWNTNFNISHNENEVLKEQNAVNQLLPSREGYSANSVWVIKTAGLDANGYPQFKKDGNIVSGDEYFGLFDEWADSYPNYLAGTKLSNDELNELFVNVGSSDPKYSGGIINTFRYKNIDLTVSANFNLGMNVMETPPYSMTQYDKARNTSKVLLDVLNGNNTRLPDLMGASSGEGQYWMQTQFYDFMRPDFYNYLDIWHKEIDYLRISSIRLGYTLPKDILNKVRLSNVRFSFEARNPFVISNGYDGYFDPESYGNIYAQPQQKSYTLGVNLTF